MHPDVICLLKDHSPTEDAKDVRICENAAKHDFLCEYEGPQEVRNSGSWRWLETTEYLEYPDPLLSANLL